MFTIAYHSQNDIQKMFRNNKILFFTDLISNGGVETHIYNLCLFFKKNSPSFEIVIFANRVNPNIKIVKDKSLTNVRINPLKAHNVNLLSKLFLNILKLLFITLSIVTSKNSTVYFLYLNKIWWYYFKVINKIKRITIIYNPVGAPESISKIINSNKTFINNVNPSIIIETHTHLKLIDPIIKNIYVIPHMSNVEFNLPVLKKKSPNIRFAFLGRIDFHKGVIDILNLFKDINIESSILTYYGNEGDALDILKKEVEEDHKLRERVFFSKGWSSNDELSQIHQQIDIAILLSKSEGLPLTLIECIAYGTPFISSNVGAIHELADNNPFACILTPPFVSEQNIHTVKKFINYTQCYPNKNQNTTSFFQEKFAKNVLFEKYYNVISEKWL